MSIRSFVKISIRCFLVVFSILIPKSNKILLFGSWFGERFSDNSRYLFLMLHNNLEKYNVQKVVWATRSPLVYSELKKAKFNVFKMNSFKSYWFHLRAGIHVIDQDPKKDIISNLSFRAKKINLWHGFPLKKIGSYVSTPTKSLLINYRKHFIQKKWFLL